MGKRVVDLVRGRGRSFGGFMFYEVGSFDKKKQAQKAADFARKRGQNARVVRVKSAKLHRDKRNYPYHLFIHGRVR
jgi:hypothetical protein